MKVCEKLMTTSGRKNRVKARYDGRVRARRIAAALRRLPPSDRRFASAVLRGATWRELGIGRRAFNKRLAKTCERLQRYTARQNKDC